MISLQDILSGFGRGVLAVGSGGISELARSQAEEKKAKTQQLGNVLAGGQIPQFAYSEETPDQINQAKLLQLASLGTPEAVKAISQMMETPEKKLERELKAAQIADERSQTDFRAKAFGLEEKKLQQEADKRKAIQDYIAQSSQGFNPMAGFNENGDMTPAGEAAFDPANRDVLALASVDPEAGLKALIDKKAKSAENQFSNESGLRKEFSGESKPFKEVASAYNRIQSSQESPQGDIALIFNYMKMLDPGSTVREGEFATAEKAAGVPTQIVQTYNKLLSGERLTPDMRKGFLSQSGDLYKAAEGQQLNLENQYKSLAEQNGFKVKNVITDFKIKTKQANAQQGAARIFDGYKVERAN